MRKDFIEIIEFATENKIATSVSTNGILIDKKLADKIIKAGLNTLVRTINRWISTVARLSTRDKRRL